MFASILRMPRSVLLSVLTIGAALTLLAAGGTFAAFTTSDSDNGDITAATLAIEVIGIGDSLDFELVTTETPCTAIVPGNVCDALVQVTNNSGVQVTITNRTAVATGDLQDCGDGGDNLISVLGAVSDVGGDTASVLAASAVETFTVTTTFTPTGTTQAEVDLCQGQTGNVVVTVFVANS